MIDKSNVADFQKKMKELLGQVTLRSRRAGAGCRPAPDPVSCHAECACEQAMDEPFLELWSIGKTYPGRDGAPGGEPRRGAAARWSGLIGENGAGKSTLMKVLGGVVAADRRPDRHRRRRACRR